MIVTIPRIFCIPINLHSSTQLRLVVLLIFGTTDDHLCLGVMNYKKATLFNRESLLTLKEIFHLQTLKLFY